MDPIKEAFTRAKQDIQELKDQLTLLSQETQFLRQTLDDILFHRQLQQAFPSDRQTDQHSSTLQTPKSTSIPAQTSQNPSIKQETPALQHIDSSTPAQNNPLKPLKDQFSVFSTGNEGVPADRQTDRQTDQQTQNSEKIDLETLHEHTFQHITDAIDTLDQAKKEVRLKFKRFTKQEMEVFGAIYSYEERGLIVDYALLAQKLGLTESSIRDYVQKLIKKGAPIVKTKENNKRILLKIDPNLKKIASLQTIHQLREL